MDAALHSSQIRTFLNISVWGSAITTHGSGWFVQILSKKVLPPYSKSADGSRRFVFVQASDELTVLRSFAKFLGNFAQTINFPNSQSTFLGTT